MNASPDLARIVEVRTGQIAPLGPKGVASAYLKSAAVQPVYVGEYGLAGDSQADRSVHGGLDKAVYGYPSSRYPDWTAAFPAIADRFVPGAMGENLVIDGLDETGIHIGDRIRVGGTLLQVTQPRQPCFKLTLFIGDPQVARTMTRRGWCGWYYRVLELGVIGAGDGHQVVERPNPDWPISRFAELIAARALGADLLSEMLGMEGLAETWQVKALKLLADLRRGGP